MESGEKASYDLVCFSSRATKVGVPCIEDCPDPEASEDYRKRPSNTWDLTCNASSKLAPDDEESVGTEACSVVPLKSSVIRNCRV